MVSSAKPISCCCSSGVRNLISGGLSLSDELILGCIMCVKVGRFHLCVPRVPRIAGALEGELTPGQQR